MGIFEGITHSEEIQELLSDAQIKYDSAKRRLESQKDNTTKSLENLGEEKVNAWSKDMNKFLESFGLFNNIQMVCKIDENYDFLGKNETPNELMVNMRNATYNANEILKVGALSVGTGALVGIATYGGVAMFANASTGTAIAALKGVAKKNATLAWLGGGSIASGGAGIAGGTVVLGGVVIGAIAAVGGVIAGAKGKAKLAEAKRVHAEAESAVSKMNVVITGMKGIETVSNNYRDFIVKLSGLFNPYLKEMDSIAGKYQRDSDGKVDFNDLSEMEQKTLHLSWLLAQLYYHILSIPLLNDKGEIDSSSRQLLQKAQQDYAQLSGQVADLENEKKTIVELLSDAKNTFSMASGSFYRKKQATRDLLIGIGKNRIDLWEKTFSPFLSRLAGFENISVKNLYPYNVTDIPIEFIFESSDAVLSYIKRLKSSGIDSLGETGFVEIALFGGEDYLGELSQQNEDDSVNQVHRHDMSLWFTGEMDPVISHNISFEDVSDNNILIVGQMVNGITGRENLSQASEINQAVKEISDKINTAISEFDIIINKGKKIENSVNRFNRIQDKCLEVIENIRRKHAITTEIVEYDSLYEEDKRVFEMLFVIAKIQYTILASCMLSQKNGGDIDDTDVVIDTANKVYKTIQKDTFKMTGDDIEVVNIIWEDNANKALIGGFVASAIFIILMIFQIISGKLIGLVGIGGALIAFPIFFYFKDLPQNKLFMWRCVRIIVAFIVVFAAEIIRLVV